MDQTATQDYAAVFPDGRTFFDETDDQAGFIKACNEAGLVASIHYPPKDADGLEPWATVRVPPEKYEEFFALGLAVGT